MCVGKSGNTDDETGAVALDVDEANTGDATTNAKPSMPRHRDNSPSVQLQKGAVKTAAAGPGVRHLKKRRFKKTVNDSRVIILKVVALFLIAATYFLVVYFLELNEFRSEVALMPEQTVAFRRLNKMHLVSFYARELALTPLEHSIFRPVEASVTAAHLELQISELRKFSDALLFGSAESVSYTHLTLPTNREV